MKTILICLMMTCCSVVAFSQNAAPAKAKPKTEDGQATKDAKPKDVMPEFPGGEPGIQKYIQENLKYPETAKRDSVQGKVYVRFTVNTQGEVTDIKLLRGVREDLDNEAKRVIQSMPKWKPGMKDGKVADMPYAIPVSYVIPKK